MKEVYYAIRYGKWLCGYEKWEGKPRFMFLRIYYDGWHYAFHIGKFWIECYV